MADSHLTKVCEKCGVEKSLDEFLRKRSVVNGVFYHVRSCRTCTASHRRQKYASNEEYRQGVRASNERQRLKDVEKHRAAIRAWYRANRDKHLEYGRKFRTLNAETNRRLQRAYAQRNKHKIVAATAKRAAAKRKAAPEWRNDFFIKEAFHLARLRTQMTGTVWHVDHIVPLRSKYVCGLHVEWNLQVIPAKANKVKSNRWWPDMWEPAEVSLLTM